LGRALDAIYAYGPERLYGQLAAQTVKRLGLPCEVGHIDAGSFHVDGVYNNGQEDVPEGVIHIAQGYRFEHNFGHGEQHLSSLLATLICSPCVAYAVRFNGRKVLPDSSKTTFAQMFVR
jgi:hypothetical protein